jgi:two-component system, NtrC family, sensor kinase
LKRVLSAHSITIARGGREALAVLETRELDLILCDLMMPELTGMDLYEQLVAKDASYAERFVFMTGGTFTRRADEFRQTVTNHFVEKPFNLSDIRRIIASFAAHTEKQSGATTAA